MLAMILALVAAPTGSPAEDPLDVRFEYRDVALFWEAFDQLERNAGHNPFQDTYLDRASQAVAEFTPDQRIESAQALYELVASERAYYAAIRAHTEHLDRFEAEARGGLIALKQLYPDAAFPPVHFVIGRTTSGGTASPAGLIIAAEVFSDEPLSTGYGRPSLPADLIPEIVVHEMIHFLQPESTGAHTLLEQALREGSADFIAELCAGSDGLRLNGADVYPYGDAHEVELWTEFQAVMNATDYGPWLYGPTPDGRPQNLGYWMGYQIAEALYDGAVDKRAAIAALIESSDAQAILEASGYAEMMAERTAVQGVAKP